MEIINNLSRSKLSLYSGLSAKKMRDKNGLFAVEGCKAVSDTLDYYELVALILLRGSNNYVHLYPKVDSSALFFVTPSEMKKLSSLSTPSDIMAIYRLPDAPRNEEIRDMINGRMRTSTSEFILALDGVRDPGNLGTIIRTAHWFGINTIFASEDTVDVYNPKVIQSTMGSIAKVKVIYTDLVKLFNSCPDIPVYGLLLDGEDLFKQNNISPGFIVMGNEGKGLSGKIIQIVREKGNRAFTIPPANPSEHPDSLNVAVATAITLSRMINQ